MLHDMGYHSSLAAPDVWIRAETKDDGTEYYAYILVYVDDILAVSHQPKTIMEQLSKLFWLKDGSGPPTSYLGATIKKWRLIGDESPRHWGHSSKEYVKQAIANVETELQANQCTLCGRYSTPMSSNYRLELDYTPFLDDKAANCEYTPGIYSVCT